MTEIFQVSDYVEYLNQCTITGSHVKAWKPHTHSGYTAHALIRIWRQGRINPFVYRELFDAAFVAYLADPQATIDDIANEFDVERTSGFEEIALSPDDPQFFAHVEATGRRTHWDDVKRHTAFR